MMSGRFIVAKMRALRSAKRKSAVDTSGPGNPSRPSPAQSQKKVKTQENALQSQEQSAPLTGSGDILVDVQASRVSCGASVQDFTFNKKRVRVLSTARDVPAERCGGIVYWMSRDQRVQDNWAFLYAQRLALKCECPVHVCFCLLPKFLDATIRHYSFMLEGLREVEEECTSLDIPFHLLKGEAVHVMASFVRSNDIGGVVTDFSPLRVSKKWMDDLIKELPTNVPLCQVDAHNVVPCWVASDKQEYGARTIRKKIHDKLKEFLTEFPPLIKHPFPSKTYPKPVDWDAAQASLEVDVSVKEVSWIKPGTKSGLQMLEEFCLKRLKGFDANRNDPTKDSLSNLSPWLHFGQVSPQRCILHVMKFRKSCSSSVDAFVEEALVRRELADNFCFYNAKYDQLGGAPEWAQKTLQDHAKDKREYVYTREDLEMSRTHDPLWNAAQMQMAREGKMHGFLRMYWAKKILEWTKSPEEALATALYLNDRYELDGRDPNGYIGCMWSVCGVHDQGWAERPVFGKIRYMNYKGCQRKFNVDAFIAKYRK